MDMNRYFDNITDSFFKGDSYDGDNIKIDLVTEIASWTLDTYKYFIDYIKAVVPDDVIREQILYHVDMAIMPTISTCRACTEDFKQQETHSEYCSNCAQDGV